MSRHQQVLVATVIFFSAACGSARAKCREIYISLEGEVKGAVTAGDQIVIEISPDSNTVADPVVLKDGYFKAKVAFDTTRSGGRFRHDCSRRPANVTTILLSNAKEQDRSTLTIEDNFSRDREGDYSLSTPIVLHNR